VFLQVGSSSGGQQAAVGLALLLAMQTMYPSPIYVMDEVDASLDSRTSRRLG
jgi:chromosome segregation protein